MLSLGVRWMGLLPRCLPHYQRRVTVPRPSLTTWYVRQETRTVTYTTKGCTLDVQAPRKVSTEVHNLSKREMCFNFSLSISV
jgi:hypothetical protein